MSSKISQISNKKQKMEHRIPCARRPKGMSDAQFNLGRVVSKRKYDEYFATPTSWKGEYNFTRPVKNPSKYTIPYRFQPVGMTDAQFTRGRPVTRSKYIEHMNPDQKIYTLSGLDIVPADQPACDFSVLLRKFLRKHAKVGSSVKVEYYGATTFSPVLFDINESVNSMFRKSGMHHKFWVGDSNGKSTYLAPWTYEYTTIMCSINQLARC